MRGKLRPGTSLNQKANSDYGPFWMQGLQDDPGQASHLTDERREPREVLCSALGEPWLLMSDPGLTMAPDGWLQTKCFDSYTAFLNLPQKPTCLPHPPSFLSSAQEKSQVTCQATSDPGFDWCQSNHLTCTGQSDKVMEIKSIC